MIKKIVALLLCLVLVFSVTGTFVAVKGGEERYPQESFSVVEKNLITGEEITKTFEEDNLEELLNENNRLNQLSVLDREQKSTREIIGNDDMQIVEDTTIWPYSAVAFITIDWPGLRASTRGTAFMISERVAVTAAHNLYHEEDGVWANSVSVYPGKDGLGLTNNPFGSLSSYALGVSNEWIEYRDSSYDWGIIVLDGELDTAETGFFIFGTDSTTPTVNMPVTVCGYSNKGILYAYNQYESNGVINEVGAYAFFHTADTLGGSSGSPILNYRGEAIGINTGYSSEKSANVGIIINDTVAAYFHYAIIEYRQ